VLVPVQLLKASSRWFRCQLARARVYSPGLIGQNELNSPNQIGILFIQRIFKKDGISLEGKHHNNSMKLANERSYVTKIATMPEQEMVSRKISSVSGQ